MTVRARKSGRKRTFGALLLRALLTLLLGVAFISPAGSKDPLSIASDVATLSVANAALDDDAGLDIPAGKVRVMPAPLSKRLPAPTTAHELAALSRSLILVADEVGQSGAECVAARRVRIWRHFPRMAPEEPPWIARVS